MRAYFLKKTSYFSVKPFVYCKMIKEGWADRDFLNRLTSETSSGLVGLL